MGRHNSASVGCHDPSMRVNIRGGSPMAEAEMENGGVPAVRKGRPRKRKQSSNHSGNLINSASFVDKN